MATNFWELLQQHQGDLTKSGRTVADYLVQHAAEAQYLSISSLAKECCVAEATVFIMVAPVLLNPDIVSKKASVILGIYPPI